MSIGLFLSQEIDEAKIVAFMVALDFPSNGRSKGMVVLLQVV
jgi:hypothetical protein